MMSSKLKWLIVIQLLLNEQALCRVPPPLALRNTPLPEADFNEAGQETAKQEHPSLLEFQLDVSSAKKPDPVLEVEQKEERVRSAQNITSVLRAKLVGQIQDHLHIQGKVSCEELLSASTVDDPSSSMFPQELLGLSLVPVLLVAGCPQEAHTLVLKLYDLLGVADAEELLMEVEGLMERRMSKSTPAPAYERDEAGRHIEAVMFNIQQLATVGEDSSKQEGHCEGWSRVRGTMLAGAAVEGATGDLQEAVSSCERLGVLCAGVTSSGLKPGKYLAVFKKGSRVLPSESTVSECWIRQCSTDEDVCTSAASGGRLKRSPQRSCINKSEQRVYNVVEWIPAVSTLYNLGTAVYYASVNCSATAKERAILSAVDLGTDALMVATGGMAGVAGYALGAGMKTGVKAGVKYLLNSMKKEDDVLVNQFSWEDGVITIQ
ncbi:uncharacterized protein apof [Pseudochaenichthys georgianus]|uniref:uncharacterized protein apof n=1 Tax=Pseudochaenichthys georgianus TaxID=52239 RepID=UPI001469A60F|nr:uncharacterized protein apof [Pseudochaenichthys georgianus]XP_033939340.1 uncharacterized protein apof [Pseudochaenichthys georgianus]